ncbi:acyltransferase family protein [Serratia sp. N21D137]|uniref:acyltransferase family protein n=1 Tax=Serratia sp. N21D137 TaxID=3397495 RepID=UPI0039E07457
MKQYVGIQYLRGLAAILVVVYHSMAMVAVTPYFPYPLGSFGVDVFFVISGFIMWTTTTHKKASPAGFFKARLFRVFPLYWIFTCVLLVSIFAVPSAFLNQRSLDVSFLIKSFFLVPTYNPDVGDITPLYTVGWTLVYEMFFYVIFALSLFVPVVRVRLAILIISFCTLVIAGALFNPQGAAALTYTNPLLLEFLAGVILGVIVNGLSKLNVKYGFAFIGLAVVLLSWGTMNEAILSRVIAFGPGAVLLVAASLVFEKSFTSKPNKFALLLGGASYSMYLAHPFAQRAWYIIETRINGGISSMSGAVIYSIGAVIAGVVGGLICYLIIEKPILSMKHKVRLLRAR